jgi:alpha/beta superfamily hydrolase
MISEQVVSLSPGAGVTLEARVAVPPDARAGIVACHPHPLYGGDMENPVVIRVVEVCNALGLATCRFNFRGVGASTGTHDQGRAEQQDVQAALDHLAGVLGAPARLLLAGYSFGAVVAARVAAGGRNLGGLALVAPPLAMAGDSPFASLPAGPILAVAGTKDEYCPEPALRALGERMPGARVVVIDGANHFFFGKLFPLGEAVREWVEALVAGQAGRGGGAA